MSTARQQKLQIEDVLKPHYRPVPSARVSGKSRFADDQWDFTDDTKVRLNSVPVSRLVVDWGFYAILKEDDGDETHRSAVLPVSIIEELKVVAYVYLKLPSAFRTRGIQSVKPQTLNTMIRALVLLFSDVYRDRYRNIVGWDMPPSYIHSLSNVTLEAIRWAQRGSDRADGAALRKGLCVMAAPALQTIYVGGPLHWNVNDVKNLDFSYPHVRDDYKKVMPNGLFRFLSNTACADVVGFLVFLGRTPCDTTIKSNISLKLSSPQHGGRLFEDYVAIRKRDRQFIFSAGRTSNNSQTARRKFKSNYGVTLQEVFRYLYRVQRAAYTVIGLYTGARYSDMTSFKTDCIECLHGTFVLRGTHTKAQDLGARENNDLWPAISVMRDALECLTQISRFTFNPYLISSCETVRIGVEPVALSLTGFTGALNNYLTEIDESQRWRDWKIHAHQLRHTLAFQLARADVGLVFIAQQMKHLHTALHALPPNVTMMYGNIGELAQQRAMQSESAYLEVAKNLYDPDKPVAGGGAEAFKQRRKAYFEGMAAQGWTADEVIKHLAKQGLPFASVGLGYCGGKRETLLKDGTKELPPCLGSLQCNPGACRQALITQTHAPQWQKVRDHNRTMVADPRMAHAKDVHRAAADAAQVVLEQLAESGVQG